MWIMILGGGGYPAHPTETETKQSTKCPVIINYNKNPYNSTDLMKSFRFFSLGGPALPEGPDGHRHPGCSL